MIVAAAVVSLFAILVVPSASRAATTVAPSAWLADVNGHVATAGTAPNGGDLGAGTPRLAVIAIAGRPRGRGYWMAALDGGVFAFGGAPFFGSHGGEPLNQPVVGIAPTPGGLGYWLVGADGGIFSYGDARFFGSLGSLSLNAPIVGAVSTPDGRGYWLVGADGGVFTFGDAPFAGSLGGRRVEVPISTIAVTSTGRGYWLLDRAGGVHVFGDARSWGSANVGASIAVGIVPAPGGNGYWIAAADGTVRSFGDAGPVGSLTHLAGPTVGMASPWASSSGFALPLLEFVRSLARPRAPARTWVGPHEVALTFDDGPGAYTAPVIAALTKYGVTATFFVVGPQVVERPDLVRAEIGSGMAVGDHAWDHVDLTRLPAANVADELRRGAATITAATGRAPVCFRPPYGATNPTVVQAGSRLGLTQILWNVDPSDYLRPGAAAIVARVLASASGRGLVVGIHDGGGDRSQTVAALPAIIFGLRSRGYTFVRLC